MAQPCSFRITFDRPDRRYAGGDTIRGSVQILVSSPVKSAGIWLTHCWRVHGIGNPHEQTLQTLQLAEPELLQTGQELNFDFNVIAPKEPLTQRGSLFAVDHYIQVSVPVAWAIDPTAEEDYILEPGDVPDQLPESRQKMTLAPSWEGSSQTTASLGGLIGCLIAVVILAVIVGVFFAEPRIPAVLTVIALAVFAYFAIRRLMLKRRLGTVELTIPHLVTAPGEPWLVELRFLPPRALRINGITLTLQAIESTVSGSGSDRKTHRRTVHDQVIPLLQTELLPAGERIHERLLMTFPETAMLSIEAGENRVRWAAIVRIDIPGSPDWTDTIPLQVLHSAFASHIPPAEELLPHWHVAGQPTSTADPAAGRFAPERFTTHASPASPDNVASNTATSTIAAVLAEINSHSPHSSARASVIRRAVGQRLAVSVTISRVASTIGAADDDPLYAGGVTVEGTIDGTRQAIRIIALASAAAAIREIPRDASWQAEVELIDWDTLYHRINARQLP